jgi:hypothetical protein
MRVRKRDKRDTVPVLIALVAWACGGAPPPVETGPVVSAVPLTRVVKPAEPDDDVAVVSEKGHVEPAVADAALAPHRSAMISCYTQKVGRRAWLGGHVVLRWAIAADGAVTRVQIAESDVGAWPIESCLLNIARDIAFGKPIGGGPAELTIPLELTTPRTLAPSDDPLVPKAVDALSAKLDGCAKGKIAMPDDVALTIYVGPRGRIQSVGFASPTTVLDDAWAACAEKVTLAWRPLESKRQVIKHLVRYRPR